MNLKLAAAGLLVVVGLSCWAAYHVAEVEGAAALATAKGEWSAEREKLATARADAESAQRLAEQRQATALNEAAQNYEKGKADAEATSAATVADLRSGALRLRDQWATCQRTTAVLSSAAGGPQPDGRADDREESAGRIVRAAVQCDAHVRGLQNALIGERSTN